MAERFTFGNLSDDKKACMLRTDTAFVSDGGAIKSCSLNDLECEYTKTNKMNESGTKDPNLILLPCGRHVFHEKCYDAYKTEHELQDDTRCPYCGDTTQLKSTQSCVVSGGKRKRSKRNTKRSKRHTKRHSKRRTHRQPKLGRR